MNFIISQILGGVALILVCIGYFLKSKSGFLIIQMVANVFYAGAFIFQNAMVAGVITLISIARCVFIYFSEKIELKESAYFIPVFVFLYLYVGVVLWSSWLDIIPICTSTIFTIGFYIKNLQVLRCVVLIPNVMLIVYSVLCKAYTNAILDAIEVAVIIWSIIHFAILKKKGEKPGTQTVYQK